MLFPELSMDVPKSCLLTTAPVPSAGKHSEIHPDWRHYRRSDYASTRYFTVLPSFQKGAAMKLSRRQFLHLVAGAAALPAVSRVATAQAYPSQPVRIIVPVPPGGALDIIARLMGQWLSERLGQPFVIENRPGAGTNIGVEAVVRAPADGYTLLLIPASVTINATLYKKLNFNFIRDIVPIAMISQVPLVMEVNLSIPARTVPEFIAYAKSNPGKVNMASGGNGSPAHIGGELFKMMTGVNMLHVPYRGGAPALTDLMGGQVQVMFSPLPESIATIKAGKVRALAVTTPKRSEALPDVPTAGEFVPGFEASTWQGIGAPKNTPAEIVATLNKEINAALADPKIKARLANLGGVPMPMPPADFENFIVAETEKWAKVIRATNIKVE
jgi:tripartite-type tricarboxylate transporter receptor subunit TctC